MTEPVGPDPASDRPLYEAEVAPSDADLAEARMEAMETLLAEREHLVAEREKVLAEREALLAQMRELIAAKKRLLHKGPPPGPSPAEPPPSRLQRILKQTKRKRR